MEDDESISFKLIDLVHPINLVSGKSFSSPSSCAHPRIKNQQPWDPFDSALSVTMPSSAKRPSPSIPQPPTQKARYTHGKLPYSHYTARRRYFRNPPYTGFPSNSTPTNTHHRYSRDPPFIPDNFPCLDTPGYSNSRRNCTDQPHT
jgi:hypothetical protein